MTIQARRVRIRLFEGERAQVEQEVERYLHAVSIENLELVSVGYNYQAPEVGLRAGTTEQVAPATHGVCVVLAERLEVNQ